VARIPFQIVTGFLGSGKTSLINRFLSGRTRERVLVMVNELGEIAVDHVLIELATGQPVVALEGGCLCCAYRGELGARLKAVLDAQPVDRILIETSGMASPAGIERELMGDPDLAPRLRAAGVIACLDALDGPARVRDFPEAEVQLALAGRILITKAELPDADLAAAAALASRLAPAASRHDGDTALEDLFADASLARSRSWTAPPHAHAHGVAVESFTLPVPAGPLADTLSWAAGLVAEAGEDILRLKGFIHDEQGRAYALHAVGGLVYPLVALPADARPEPIVVLIGAKGLRAKLTPYSAVAATLANGRQPSHNTRAANGQTTADSTLRAGPSAA
jgi:G3E family GTPase